MCALSISRCAAVRAARRVGARQRRRHGCAAGAPAAQPCRGRASARHDCGSSAGSRRSCGPPATGRGAPGWSCRCSTARATSRTTAALSPRPASTSWGMQFLRRRKSALIDGAGDDARDLSAHILGLPRQICSTAERLIAPYFHRQRGGGPTRTRTFPKTTGVSFLMLLMAPPPAHEPCTRLRQSVTSVFGVRAGNMRRAVKPTRQMAAVGQNASFAWLRKIPTFGGLFPAA